MKFNFKLNNYFNNKNALYLFYILLLVIVFIFVILKSKYNELFTNMNGLNKCDGLVYINLENRPDRKTLLLEEVKKINIDENKLFKVSGIYIPKNGHKGCSQSHIIALNIAKMNNWNITCIMEDDMELLVSPKEFNDHINDIFNEIDKKNIHWDVLLLSHVNKIINNNSEKYSYLERLKSMTTATCYLIKKEYIDKLLHVFEKSQLLMNYDKWGNDNKFEYNALDQKWLQLMPIDNWYTSKINLIKQRNIKSTTNAKGI